MLQSRGVPYAVERGSAAALSCTTRKQREAVGGEMYAVFANRISKHQIIIDEAYPKYLAIRKAWFPSE